jgi:serine protease SohB
MQTFSDWIQFIVSAAVVVLLLSIFLTLIILIVRRRSTQTDKRDFKVEHLNKTWLNNEDKLRSAILPADEYEKIIKERQKKAKTKRLSKKETNQELKKRRVFVFDFDGDLSASGCSTLREAISVLIAVAEASDEVVIRLESPGGVVHGYGLAASQLARLSERKIKLTVCVDKVAASGGYMMACVANKIIAAPFSVIGSIGVVSSMPNFNKMLKKNNIDYIEQTAGDYKRTVTLFGELNESKIKKHQQDLDVIHSLFKEHVAHFRPQVDINSVSTGEIWLGRHALEKQLIDELKTSDDLLLELGREADVFLLKYESEQNWKARLLKQFFSSIVLNILNLMVKK